MTVRNIRAHQSRGLLPAPEIKGRTGFYGPEHVARLELISEMQADGFNLQAIKRLVGASDGAVEQILGFRRALMTPFGEEEPELVTQEELEERWGRLDTKLLRKAEKLELVRPLGEGRYEIPSPTLYRAGEQVLALGVSPQTALSVAESIKRRSEAISESFVELFFRGGREPGGRVAPGSRRARASTAARLGSRGRVLPASDDRGGRGGLRQGARAKPIPGLEAESRDAYRSGLSGKTSSIVKRET